MSASARAFAAKLLGGQIGSKYRLEKVLGMGGTAVVFEARHRNGHRVAIKALLPDFADEPDVRRRFLKEGYAANAVEHDGAVRVIDDDVSPEGVVYVVMEYLDGRTIEDMLTSSRSELATGWVLAVGFQILDVLAAAHSAGIVHRDIKPANLFLTYKGVLKVLDFGIARFADSSGERTRTTQSLGTPAYASPEQMFGRQDLVDHRTDIFGTGATMFRLLTGKRPRGNDGRVLPLRTILPDASEDLAELVDRALRDDRDERWADARAMQRVLRIIYERMEGVPLHSASTALQTMRLRSSRPPASTLPAKADPKLSSRPAASQRPTLSSETLPSEGVAGPSSSPAVPGHASQSRAPRTHAGTAVSAEPAATPSQLRLHGWSRRAWAIGVLLAAVVLVGALMLSRRAGDSVVVGSLSSTVAVAESVSRPTSTASIVLPSSAEANASARPDSTAVLPPPSAPSNRFLAGRPPPQYSARVPIGSTPAATRVAVPFPTRTPD